MKKAEQLFTPSVKRIIYGGTFLLGVSMTNYINIPGISPETVYAGTLIPNVTATASSYVDPYGPERAVDLDATNAYSRWYCTGSDKYLVLDLKGSYKIDRWVVKNLGTVGWDSSANTKDYKLIGSMDGNTWFTIDTVSNNIQNFTDINILNPVSARYVKLEITAGNQTNNNWASIVEFNVYAAPASISSVSVPANGTYKTGNVLNFTVNFDGNVNLAGTASNLSLDIGGQIKQATFASKTVNSITYSYTVQSRDLDKDGINIAALNLNGDVIKDSLNNAVSPALNNIGNTSGILVESPYKINIPSLTGGSISTSPTVEASAVTSVTVNVTPNAGMRLKENTLKYNDGTDHPITGNTFVMPNSDVTISAEFEPIPSLVISSNVLDGTILKSGDTVKLTAEDGAAIYYTVGTDSAEPADPTTSSSSISSGGSITITGAPGETVKVKSYAVKAGVPDSQISTFTYKIKEKKILTVTGLSAANKSYDGTTAATITGTAALDVAGIVSGYENVGISGTPIAQFASKDAGTGKSVTVDGYALTGADAAYYELTKPTLNADITAKDTTVTGIIGVNKLYDGTTTAAVNISGASFSGLVAGDSISIDLSNATMEFENASEGIDKKVNVSGIKLAGEDKDNYRLTNDSLQLTADILPMLQPPLPPVIPTFPPINPPLPPQPPVNPPIIQCINSVQVTPASVSISQGQSLQLTATVYAIGGANNGVTWLSSDGTGKVTVTPSGIVNVAADAATDNYTITAISTFDPTKTGRVSVTVTAIQPPVIPPINPPIPPVNPPQPPLPPVLPPTPPIVPVNPPVPPVIPPVTPQEPANNNTAIKILSQSGNQIVTRGDSVSFSVKVEGTEPFVYQWQKDGLALSDIGNISGTNKEKLKIDQARKSDAGKYSCIITDGIGNVTTSSAVTLRVTSGTTTSNSSSNNAGSSNRNSTGTTTISISAGEAGSAPSLDRIMNALNSQNINTIIDISQINVANGVPQNQTNSAGGANPPLLSENILGVLKTNLTKTLTIKNGDSSIQIKATPKGEIQFTQNNTVMTGFVAVGNSEYYLNQNGIMQNGWIQQPGNVYYYFNPATGVKEKGWAKDVNGIWYYLDTASGIMKTDWLNDNGTWYYLNSNGSMATGWTKVDGSWYYLYPNGSMAKNTTIDGYVVGGDGAWI